MAGARGQSRYLTGSVPAQDGSQAAAVRLASVRLDSSPDIAVGLRRCTLIGGRPLLRKIAPPRRAPGAAVAYYGQGAGAPLS